MPNWITNNVTIIADEKLLAKIRKELKSGDRDFDFNKISPIPKELEGTISPIKIISQEEFVEQEERISKGDLTDSEKKFGVSRGITEKMKKNFIKRFGYADWYSWKLNEWGTKWNSSEVCWNDSSDHVSFSTAWSTPFPIFEKLSKKYPEARFEVEYSDEDFGYNVGTYTLVGGVEVEVNVPEGGSREAIELAMVVQYGGIDEYDFCDEFLELYGDKINDYQENMIVIAYSQGVYPFEGCEWDTLVLERFKELALADEKFELVVLIEKELEKVEK